MAVGALQAGETIKVLLGEGTPGLVSVDLWSGEFQRLRVDSRPSADCPACHGRYDFSMPGSACGRRLSAGRTRCRCWAAATRRSPSIEVARRLRSIGDVEYNEFMLRFVVDGYEMVIFPDGRAIVKGTEDESVARGMYAKYVGM